MLAALTEAHRARLENNRTDMLLEVLIGQVRLLWRQQVIDGNREDPGPLDLHPERTKKKQSGWKRAAAAALAGLRR